MNVVLLRVGLDTGCGGGHGALFSDGRFEFIPIPDDRGLDERTYGNTRGRSQLRLVEFFPASRRAAIEDQPMHVDPEFESFTYGDPTPPKRGLARLHEGDLLGFYAGLQGWGFESPPALYLVGLFEVELAGFASNFSAGEIRTVFGKNFHVHHQTLFAQQREHLVLIKGGSGSRLFAKAHLLGGAVRRANGSCWQVISPEMEKVFGTFGGIGSLQRSNPRWVDAEHTAMAATYLRSLE